MSPAADDEIARLRRALLVLARRIRQQSAGEMLSATEMSVLGRILRGEARTPGQLAKAEHVQPPSMTKVLETLTERKFVIRRPNPDDGRQQLLEITAAGSAFVEATRERRSQWLASHLDALSADDRATVIAAIPVLERLAELP